MKKSGLKTGGHHAIFWVLEVKRSKMLQKLNKRDCFCLHYLVSFFMAFLVQKLIFTINIWFNFVFGSFLEQDHLLLNLFVSGVYAKRWPKCAHISIQKLMQPKIWPMGFFLNLTVRGPFHRKDFKWKKNWRYRVNFWKKWKFCMQNLTKERKQPPVDVSNLLKWMGNIWDFLTKPDQFEKLFHG